MFWLSNAFNGGNSYAELQHPRPREALTVYSAQTLLRQYQIDSPNFILINLRHADAQNERSMVTVESLPSQSAGELSFLPKVSKQTILSSLAPNGNIETNLASAFLV